IEQLGDHGGHAIEVAGPAGTAQTIRYHRHLYNALALLAIGVHFVHIRREQYIAAGGAQPGLIIRQGARVAGQVVFIVELQRVHKNAGHGKTLVATGAVDQADMAVVQVAHGRHKANTAAAGAGVTDVLTPFADGMNSNHAENPWSAAGSGPDFTSAT